jgi:hypothetical protein
MVDTTCPEIPNGIAQEKKVLFISKELGEFSDLLQAWLS